MLEDDEGLGQGCGWDRVWDKSKLIVPPQVASGTDGIRGGVLPDASLSFIIAVVDVKWMHCLQ
jgi:FKBP-type peptidyl-prolyl cis-trans isomerase